MNKSFAIRKRQGKPIRRSGIVAALAVISCLVVGSSAEGQWTSAGSAQNPIFPGNIEGTVLPGDPLPPGQPLPGELDPAIGEGPYPMETDAGPWEPGLGWACGGGCPPSWRGRAEWLEFTRNRSGDSLSNGFPFDNFHYEEGLRITVDRRYDCTEGWEIVYAGPLNFRQVSSATGAGTLNATVVPFDGVNLSAFFDADVHRQLYDSQLHSAEGSYKSWGWNVIATSWGCRYINLDEQFVFVSRTGAGDVGFLRVDTDNNLVLGQFGLDMLFPIGRWSFDTTWKGGLGFNVGSSNVFVGNTGVAQINRFDQDIEFSALIEGGTFARYFITPRLTARVGYEFWWIHGVGLASRQFGDRITRNTGRDFRGTNEVTFFGASAGIEYVW